VQPLTVSLIQTATRWHDPAGNRALFDAGSLEVPATSALVVLPEMFSTGFTMASAEVAEPMDGSHGRLAACVGGAAGQGGVRQPGDR
jgi:omega-amidase